MGFQELSIKKQSKTVGKSGICTLDHPDGKESILGTG